MAERDKILVERARKAAEDLQLALEEASAAGLIVVCSASHSSDGR